MSSRSKANNNKKRTNKVIYSESKEGHIPSFSSNVTVTRKFRFAAQSSAVVKISNNDILAALGSMCTTGGISGYCLAQSYQLKQIEIWSPIASQGTSATCSIEWTANSSAANFNSSLQTSDTSINPLSPAHVRVRPPKGSVASFWQEPSASAINLMSITAPAASIIDLTVKYVLLDDNANRVLTTYTSGVATLGFAYYGYLDNYETNPPVLKPVSLTPNF